MVSSPLDVGRGQANDESWRQPIHRQETSHNDREKPIHQPAKLDDTIHDVVYPKGLRLFGIVVVFCLAVLLVALDETIIATAIPRITDRFNSVQDVWYGSVRFKSPVFDSDSSDDSFLGVHFDGNIIATYIWEGLQDIQRTFCRPSNLLLTLTCAID